MENVAPKCHPKHRAEGHLLCRLTPAGSVRHGGPSSRHEDTDAFHPHSVLRKKRVVLGLFGFF